MLAAAVLGQQNAGPAVFEIAATAVTESSTSTVSSHTANMPAGVSSGDLLVMAVRLGSNGALGAITLTGWTSVVASSDGFSLQQVFKRVADGSEGASVAFTTSSTNTHATVVYRITGAHGDVEGAAAESAVVAADAPSLSPSWGSAENIWITTYGHRQGPSSATPPSGYANALRGDVGLTNNNNACIYAADRVATASSEDPGVWSITGTFVRSNATTIAVRPA